jgi:bifunctional oligoribonuclease and PAP phosphatase NrnA
VSELWQQALAPGAMAAAVDCRTEVASAGGTIVLACHVGPDGDALGATLALHLALKELGARSVPTWGEEPLRVPAPYFDLPGVEDLTAPSDLPRDPALLVTLDAASEERLGSVRSLLDTGVPTIVVDHHVTNTGFGDVKLVAPDAAATVTVIERLVHDLGVEVGPEIATCLYVGLVTDTGRFQHANTDRATMELAGRLIEAGAPHEELGRRLFDTRSLGEVTVVGRALARLEFVPDVALAHTYVSAVELDAAGVGIEQIEGLIDLVRSVDVAEVAMVAKEAGDGWRVSLRSKGAVDVGAIAVRLGGGGHAYAGGYTSRVGVDEVVKELLEQLRAES